MLLQASEAKELGFEKLAEHVLSVMGPVAREEKERVVYSSNELNDDVRKKLWKIAVDLITYHDVDGVDIQRVDDAILHLASIVTREIEKAIDSEAKVGGLEPLLPGESR